MTFMSSTGGDEVNCASPHRRENGKDFGNFGGGMLSSDRRVGLPIRKSPEISGTAYCHDTYI